MSHIRPLLPLLATAGILIGGNGLQATFIALRGTSEGFSTTTIGLISAAYCFGFAIGCFTVTRILASVGHIRTFAAMAAIAASTSLLMSVVVNPISWILARFVIGIAVAALYAVIEGWINANVTNSTRARTLSIYRFVDLGAVTLAQYLIPTFGIEGHIIFSLITIFIVMSIVPICLADKSQPTVPKQMKINFASVWRISPIAVVGSVAVGLSMAAFRNIGPIYAEKIGMSATQIATFMSAGIIGGVVLQYPLGSLSDRFDRRLVMFGTTGGSVIAGLYLALFAGSNEWANIIGVFVFGAFALPLYGLCSAHGNDHAGPGEHSTISAGILFFWSCGATAGPLLVSGLMDLFGPVAMFYYTAGIQILFMGYTLYRLSVRPSIPVGERRFRFRTLFRSTIFFPKEQANSDKKD